jgi:guanylate kinase
MNSTLSESRAPFPLFIVISGPSGVGKDALIQRLVARGNPLHVVVTYTTREVRANEKHGVDYIYMSPEQFRGHADAGRMLEWAEVYEKRYYGVPLLPVRDGLVSGKDTIVRVDIQGARTLRRVAPDAIQVLLVPPSLEVLEKRLRERGRDNASSIRERVLSAEREMNDLSVYDYAIVNEEGKLDKAAEVVEAIILAEKHRAHPRRVVV